MKLAAVLVAGCVPLVVLTVQNFLTEPESAKPLPVPAISDQELAEFVQAADASVASADAQSDHLGTHTEVDLIGLEKLAAVPQSAAPPEHFEDLAGALLGAARTHDGVVGLVPPIKKLRDKIEDNESEHATVQADLTELKDEWAEGQPFAGLRRTERVQQHVEQVIAESEHWLKVKEICTTAQQQFDSAQSRSDFSVCLATLDQVAEIGNADAFTKEIETLQSRATFWQHWYLKPKPAEETPAWREQRLAELKRLLPLSSGPQPRREDETEHVVSIKQALPDLETAVEFDDFIGKPPDQPGPFMDKLKRFQGKFRGDARQDKLVAAFNAWIDKRIPLKPKVDTSAEIRIREAELKDGSLLVGVFKQSGTVRVWYKYWSSVDKYRGGSSPQGERQVYEKTQLLGAPKDPLDVRFAMTFNEARGELFRSLSSQQEWRRFQEVCEGLEPQLEEYKKKFQKTGKTRAVPGLSFRADAEIATIVLENWKVVEELYSN